MAARSDVVVSAQPVASLDPQLRRRIGDLVEAASAAAGHPVLSDEARLDVLAGDATSTASALVARRGGEDALWGYAGLSHHGEDFAVEAAVDPSAEPGAATAALLQTACDEVARRGGGRLRLWLHGPGHADELLAAELGFGAERELLQLRVSLPLAPIVDLGPPAAVRAFRPGEDDDTWLAANNRAFAGHPEQSGWTRGDLDRRRAEAWFDPAGFLLHEQAGRLAAFCWTKVHAAEGLGEIYVIGVDPDFQGRGLGRALTVAGLSHLASRGVPTGMLYVDAANEAAVALYRSLGFWVHHADRSYVRDVGPAQLPVDTPTARPIP